MFISPDRTENDRKKQRKLVVEMRRLCDEKPGMRHYIRSGKVIGVRTLRGTKFSLFVVDRRCRPEAARGRDVAEQNKLKSI